MDPIYHEFLSNYTSQCTRESYQNDLLQFLKYLKTKENIQNIRQGRKNSHY